MLAESNAVAKRERETSWLWFPLVDSVGPFPPPAPPELARAAKVDLNGSRERRENELGSSSPLWPKLNFSIVFDEPSPLACSLSTRLAHSQDRDDESAGGTLRARATQGTR